MFSFLLKLHKAVDDWLKYGCTWDEFKAKLTEPEVEYTSEYIECSLYKRHK